jgi:hypothetical protein
VSVRAGLLWIVLTSPAVPAVALAAPDGTGEPATTDEPVDLTQPSQPPAATPPGAGDEAPPIGAAERRCGFTIGLLGGGHLGTARGYPNDALKIDREEFLTDVGFAGGGVGELFVGIALADWMVFGLGFAYGGTLSSDHESRFGAMAFRIDAFPAYPAGGAFRDLGLMLEAGLGMTNTDVAADERRVIDSGLASRVAIGAFYEGIRLWKISMGPYAAADVMFSSSVTQPAAWIGWRSVLYAGP